MRGGFVLNCQLLLIGYIYKKAGGDIADLHAREELLRITYFITERLNFPGSVFCSSPHILNPIFNCISTSESNLGKVWKEDNPHNF